MKALDFFCAARTAVLVLSYHAGTGTGDGDVDKPVVFLVGWSGNRGRQDSKCPRAHYLTPPVIAMTAGPRGGI